MIVTDLRPTDKARRKTHLVPGKNLFDKRQKKGKRRRALRRLIDTDWGIIQHQSARARPIVRYG